MIATARLILRPWRDSDRTPFAEINRDPAVTRWLGGPKDAADSDAMIERQRVMQADRGHCFWAVERRDDSRLIGFCGLRIGGHPGTPVRDELEIGWRFAANCWGQGYAREAAEASIAWGFANTDRNRIVAWTVPGNAPSWGLMLRLGMTPRPQLDFDHPQFASGHPLCRHVVYAIDRAG